MKDILEMVQIWVPADKGEGEAIYIRQGEKLKNMKLAALLVEGKIVRLEEGVVVERTPVTKEEAQNIVYAASRRGH